MLVKEECKTTILDLGVYANFGMEFLLMFLFPILLNEIAMQVLIVITITLDFDYVLHR